MKYAWWLIVGFILFLLCTQQTFAAEVAGFDPTQQYVVHSVPLYTENSVVVTFEDEKKPPVVSPAEHTPEVGSEGKQEISLAESSNNVDLSALTYAAKKQESSKLSNLGHNISSWLSYAFDEVSLFVRSGWANAGASLMQFSFGSILAISARLNKWLGDLTFVINKYIGFLREHALPFAVASVVAPGLALLTTTTLGKAALVGVANFVIAGVVSAADIVLHAGSYGFGLLNALRTGSTITEGYQIAKDFIKKKTGHDIGGASVDLQVVATRLIVAVAIFVGVQLLVAGVAAVGAISAETAPELILRSNIALSKTSTDCNMPGQCDTPAALGITAGSNFLFGVAPQQGMQLVDDEAKAVKSVMTQVDEIEEVSKYWYKSTFDTVEESIEYHVGEHAAKYNKSLKEYTNDAKTFFEKNKENGERTILKDGTPGLKFQNGKTGDGGYFTENGQIVTFWYKKI